MLIAHPELAIVPLGVDEVVVAGELAFAVTGPDATFIRDSYQVVMRIPRSYPASGFPRLFEKGGRIPANFHHLSDGSLCLGAPTRLRRVALRTPRIGDFIAQLVVPYLYSRSYYERFHRMPFGELAHGKLGLERDLIAMLHMPCGTRVDEVLEAAAIRKRHANKRRCPCGSGRRLGRCHNNAVNLARAEFGRSWFAGQLMQLFGRTVGV